MRSRSGDRFHRRAVGYLALLVCLSWLPGPGVGLVFCLSADGHCELELARGDRCCDPSELNIGTISSPSTLETESAGEHCDTCFDLPLATGERGLMPKTSGGRTSNRLRIDHLMVTLADDQLRQLDLNRHLELGDGNRLLLRPLLATTILII